MKPKYSLAADGYFPGRKEIELRIIQNKNAFPFIQRLTEDMGLVLKTLRLPFEILIVERMNILFAEVCVTPLYLPMHP
jgi:hypothetical protein